MKAHFCSILIRVSIVLIDEQNEQNAEIAYLHTLLEKHFLFFQII